MNRLSLFFEQYPELQKTQFTVCNGDNLYSSAVFQRLKEPRKVPHALISYARSGLNFPDERIAKFAVMDIDSEGFLKNIIEKPAASEVEAEVQSLPCSCRRDGAPVFDTEQR